MIELVLAETVTGRIVDRLNWTALSWTSTLSDDAGKLDATIKLPAGHRSIVALRVNDLRGRTSPWRFTAAAVEGSRVYWAGPITNRDFADELTLSAADIWQVFNARILLGSYTTALSSTAADITLGAATLPGLAREMVAAGMACPGGTLPVVLPDSEMSKVVTRKYFGYEQKMAGAALAELSQADGGPEVRFAPRLADPQHLVWDLRIGRPLLAQTGDALGWHTQGNAVRAPIPWDEDASTLATSYWVTGDGQERDLRSSRADNTDLIAAGWPALHVVDTGHTDGAAEQSTLDAYATAGARAGRLPLVRMGLTVDTTRNPPLASYDPGYRVTITSTRHPWIPDGDYSFRIVTIGVDAAKNTAELSLDAAVGTL